MEERGLTKGQQHLADMLFNRGAIMFGAFKLKLHEKNPDTPLSPIYLTLRTPENGGPLTDDDVEVIGQELYNMVQRESVIFDLVVGIPRAGEPFAKVVSRLSGKPLLKLGKKIEGNQRKIDSIVSGEYRPVQLVLLIDDLITQADTKKEAINVCEEAGLKVVGVAVFLDREQGGSEKLRRMGYNVYIVLTLTALLDFYVRVGEIDSRLHAFVMNYIANNK